MRRVWLNARSELAYSVWTNGWQGPWIPERRFYDRVNGCGTDFTGSATHDSFEKRFIYLTINAEDYQYLKNRYKPGMKDTYSMAA